MVDVFADHSLRFVYVHCAHQALHAPLPASVSRLSKQVHIPVRDSLMILDDESDSALPMQTQTLPNHSCQTDPSPYHAL